jgi:hypothetical protein
MPNLDVKTHEIAALAAYLTANDGVGLPRKARRYAGRHFGFFRNGLTPTLWRDVAE